MMHADVLQPDPFARLYEAHGIGTAPPSAGRRAVIAATIYHAVKSGFCHWSDARAEAAFDTDFAAYAQACMQAHTRSEYVRLGMRLLAGLGNGHTHFDELGLGPAEATTGFLARPCAAGWVVTRSARADLQAGDVIATVDGQPVRSWAEPILALMGKSSLRAKKVGLFGFALLPPRFTLRLADGRSLAIDRMTPCALAADTQCEAAFPGAGDVMLLRLPSFAAPEDEERALGHLGGHGDKPVILDLRGNDGGNTPDALLAAIILAPHAQMICETPLRVGYFEASGQADARWNPFPGALIRSLPVTVQPRDPFFHGRLIALVDGACASACEDFLLAFLASGRGPIVGETTCGSTGQPLVHRFEEENLQVSVGTTRFLFPDGTRLEGVGITPHVPVAVTPDDLRAGRDPVLAAALELTALPQARYQAVFGPPPSSGVR